jgi:heme a synthase
MNYSLRFVRFNWIALGLIYLVVFAGSFVRITGSGMGCPDWPKCFGQWIPPTELTELPADYREIYLAKREKKVEKFCRFLNGIGLSKTADKIKNDPSVYIEESFNATKTWTEYINRLAGFLAGNALLLAFFWMLFFYRSKLVILAGINLIILAIEAWFGSIVVATNLVPWTITVHLLLALVIIAIQLYIIHRISPIFRVTKQTEQKLKWIVYLVFAITFYQMFLGTQVREYIDELTKQGFGREDWTEKLGLSFYIHRSFSWLVLALIVWLAYKNEKQDKWSSIRFVFVILCIELLTGVLLAHADMPGLVQTAHLVFASILFGALWMMTLRMRSENTATLQH